MDHTVRHAYVITTDDAGRLVEDGAIAIAGRRIVEVRTDAGVVALYAADRTIDAVGAPVHLGLVESHMHASFQPFRGVIHDHISGDEVFDAIECVFYNTVTYDEEHAGTPYACREIVRNGTTCFMPTSARARSRACTSTCRRIRCP